ncbi:unnamed protein product [Arabis nemorensis]|uniref:Secreted protein n=1 Tax=Arabis nemorensis TaxID=586526 RepID=A0A565C8M9_9BRAS|nr:unnamed protein product [Arabis nemorensis]
MKLHPLMKLGTQVLTFLCLTDGGDHGDTRVQGNNRCKLWDPHIQPSQDFNMTASAQWILRERPVKPTQKMQQMEWSGVECC